MEDGRAFESSEISLNENSLAVVDDHFQLSTMNYLSCEVTGDRNQLKWNGYSIRFTAIRRASTKT